MIVETTSTLHTYTFHRVTPKATEVTTVASNIASVNTTATNITNVNTFANVYRIASSAPSSNNDDGDLYYNTSDNKLYVYNGSAWEVAASLNGSGGTVTGDITFTDDVKLNLGTGSDLQIWHDGSHGRIQNSTGHFYLRANSADVGIEIVPNGTVKLRYDGANKLQTTSAGVQVVGELQATGDFHLNNNTNSGKDVKFVAASNLFRIYDDVKLTCGNSDDLQIYHDGSTSYISNGTGELQIANTGSGAAIFLQAKAGENCVKGLANGAVELYYDGSKKFETTSTGADVSGLLVVDQDWISDTGSINIESSANVLSGIGFRSNNTYTGGFIYRDGTAGNFFEINSQGDRDIKIQTGGDTAAYFHADGAGELYYDGSKKLETDPDGVKFNDDTYVLDGNSSYWGTGNDLRITHSGNHGYFDNHTGNLYIRNDGNNDNSDIHIQLSLIHI